MAVSTKGRRKITVGGESYLWSISNDPDGHWTLNVISPDKKFLAKYALHQDPGEEYILILGPRFAGAETGATWKRFLCPRFGSEAVTPANVRHLIEWCLDEQLSRQETDWEDRNLII